MIQHQYRRVNPPTMIPSCDAVCPRCHHVFPVSAVPSLVPLTKLSPTHSLHGTASVNIPEHCPIPSRNEFSSPTSYSLLPQLQLPPALPPRPKLSKSPLYINVPSSTSTTSTTSSSTKPYVTMSNMNLPLNSQFVYNGAASTTGGPRPNFMPLNSPTQQTSLPILPLLSAHTTNPSTLLPSSSNGRVYRQLSGGGLINPNAQNVRIHEPQRMHPLSGGGLVNTKCDDNLFQSNEIASLPILQLPLDLRSPSPRETKSTKLLISTVHDSVEANSTSPRQSSHSTSISISGIDSRSNSPTISIVVPSTSTSSLEISMKNIAISLPPTIPSPPPNKPAATLPPSPFEAMAYRDECSNSSSPSSSHSDIPGLLVPTEEIPPQPPQMYPSRFPQPVNSFFFNNKPIDDMQCLTKTFNCLKESGWFHEGLSWNDSEALLAGSDNGTFIVRESSNSSFLFAITVQTAQEPTSVRIQYDNGRFRLDCVSHVTSIVPQFDCLLDLIEYYVTQHEMEQRIAELHPRITGSFTTGNQVFVDENGQFNSIVSLKKPLRSSVPSLMHCARLSVNKQLKDKHRKFLPQSINTLELPNSLKNYLLEYPFTL